MILCHYCTHCSLREEESPVFCAENSEVQHPHVFCVVKGCFVHPPDPCTDYNSKAQQDRRIYESSLSHEGIMELCLKYVQDHGWEPFPLSQIEHLQGVGTPDLLAWKQNEVIRAFEIKPWNCSKDEVRRGIGQCAYYLLHSFKPFLVVPSPYRRELQEVFRFIPALGLIAYTQDRSLEILQGEPL